MKRFSVRFFFLVCSILTCMPLSAQLGKREVQVIYKTDSLDNKQLFAEIYRTDWSAPAIVPIGSEDTFPELYDVQVHDWDFYCDRLSHRLFDFLVSPIEKYIKPGWKVYYVPAPASLFYFINIEALEMSDGSPAYTKYHFYRMSDRRLWPKDRSLNGAGIVPEMFAYGGMNYEASFEKMREASRMLHLSDFHRYNDDIKRSVPGEISFGDVEDGTRAGYDRLLYSKDEVKSIDKLWGLFARHRTEENALEEKFREDARLRQPYIMHISTHSFQSQVNSQVPTKDQLYASRGILFSGAGHSLRGERMPYKMNDGLLYGDEIAELDMSNCELLVLAACNTAQGTVTSAGVFGLQQAFKDAGVQALLLTLWAVNDKATSVFMERFYSYLTSGSSIHKSLDKARDDMRNSQDYSAPIYWAPFILVD